MSSLRDLGFPSGGSPPLPFGGLTGHSGVPVCPFLVPGFSDLSLDRLLERRPVWRFLGPRFSDLSLDRLLERRPVWRRSSILAHRFLPRSLERLLDFRWLVRFGGESPWLNWEARYRLLSRSGGLALLLMGDLRGRSSLLDLSRRRSTDRGSRRRFQRSVSRLRLLLPLRSRPPSRLPDCSSDPGSDSSPGGLGGLSFFF
jgi:hypothetical protein